jgi:transposase-like protein
MNRPGIPGDFGSREDGVISTTKRYRSELRERPVRLVFEIEAQHGSQWAAIASIAPKVDCTTETLRRWMRQAGPDQGRRAGLTST